MANPRPCLRDGAVTIAFAFESPKPELAERLRAAGGRRYAVNLGADDEGGCRLDLDLKNSSPRPVDVTLDISWEHKSWARLIGEAYVRPPRAREWKPITLRTEGEASRALLRLPPGATALAVCPRYGYADLQAYLARLAGRPEVRLDSLCPSGKGRDIPLVTVSSPAGPAPRENVLVVSRPHAYESAGSLMVEGMIDMLLDGASPADAFLDDFVFHFIPMHNVDGVMDGLGRYTRPGGADLNRDVDANRLHRPAGAADDRELTAHIHLIDHLQPAAYLNIHNWTGRFTDGLIGYDQEEVDIFERFMPACVDHQKAWSKMCRVIPGNRSPGRYARETYGTLAYVVEFPWYLRTFDAMRDVGRRCLTALMHSLLHRRAEARRKAVEAAGES